MTRDEFTKELRRLQSAMSRAKITVEERDVLFDLLSFIPSPAWPAIVSEAIRLWDTWPRNFAKEVKALWHQWLSAHPDLQAKAGKTTCFQCHASTGFIWATSESPDLPYKPTAVFRCAYCDNADASAGIPRKTRDQIVDLGYQIDDSGRYQPGDETVTPVRRDLPPVTLKPVSSRRSP